MNHPAYTLKVYTGSVFGNIANTGVILFWNDFSTLFARHSEEWSLSSNAISSNTAIATTLYRLNEIEVSNSFKVRKEKMSSSTNGIMMNLDGARSIVIKGIRELTTTEYTVPNESNKKTPAVKKELIDFLIWPV